MRVHPKGKHTEPQAPRESPQGLISGQVLWGANNIFSVACCDGSWRQCRLKGKTLKQTDIEYNPLICGDFVELQPVGGSEGLIYSRRARRNALQRRNVKHGEPQAFAANIDGIVLLVSWNEPPLREAFLDRLLIAAQRADCPIWILLNKIDCLTNWQELRRLQQFARLYRHKLGLELWPVSLQLLQAPKSALAKLATPHPKVSLQAHKLPIRWWRKLLGKIGTIIVRQYIYCVYIRPSRGRLRRLYAKLAGKLYVVLGSSGVGKSSLCNYWFTPQSQEVRAISQKWQRGMQTTTLARTLVEHRNGLRYALIDTPGMRNFLPALCQSELPQLQQYYPEFAGPRKICGYSSCQHRNEPDCAVREAADYGLISRRRYLSYCSLYRDLESSFAAIPAYQTQTKGGVIGAEPTQKERHKKQRELKYAKSIKQDNNKRAARQKAKQLAAQKATKQQGRPKKQTEKLELYYNDRGELETRD